MAILRIYLLIFAIMMINPDQPHTYQWISCRVWLHLPESAIAKRAFRILVETWFCS